MKYNETTQHLVNKEVMNLVSQLRQPCYSNPLRQIGQELNKVRDPLYQKECIMNDITQLNVDFPELINYKEIHDAYLNDRAEKVVKLICFGRVIDEVVEG